MLRTAGNCAGFLRSGGVAFFNDSLIAEDLANLAARRWATKKQGGSTKNTKDSHPKHLGVKINEGQLIYPGQIILRQRGTKFFPGDNVAMGKDHTLHAKAVGFVKFSEVPFERLNVFRRRRYVHVVPRNQHWELDPDADQSEMVATKAAAKQLLSRFYRQTSISTAQ